jgi:hypothetical protein
LKLTEYTYPQNKAFGTKFTMQMIQIPEHALEKFGQFINELHNAQLQSLDQDYNISGHLLMIRTKHDDWKAKATITLVKTTSGMERMVTSTSFIKHTCELKKTTSITPVSEMRTKYSKTKKPNIHGI